jgi:phosphoglycerate dehydrogenase-like enzyme
MEIRANEEEKFQKLRNADFIIGYPAILSKKDFEVASQVKLIQLLSMGAVGLDLEGAKLAGIPVANIGGANSISVAEHTILLILSLYKKLPLHNNSLKAGKWLGHTRVLEMNELAGKIIGIIGLGNIGKELIKRLKVFEAKVNYYDIYQFKEFEREMDVRFLSLEDLLKSSDIVSLHVPLTKETRSMIGERELNLMKKSAILINTSRGPVVDEKALYQALKARKIAGAGLDVFVQEGPLQAGGPNPLFELENVVVTPHTAGATYDTWFRRIGNAFKNIVRVAEGQKPRWIVRVAEDQKPEWI